MNLMSKKNIFLQDVEVPEVVVKEADIAFSKIQRKGENRMKKEQNTGKIIKITGAFAVCAACAALVIATGASKGVWDHFAGKSAEQAEEITEIAAEETIDTKDDTLMSAINDMFTLRVMAAEPEGDGDASDLQSVPLVAGEPVPIVSGDTSSSWVLGGGDDGTVNYCISMPLICEGENIEKVTYSISKGAFQIVQPENEQSIIIDGQLYGKELNTGSIGGDYSEENDGYPSRPFETVLYSSFTLDYQKQSDEYTWINICDEMSESGEIKELIWGDDYGMEEENRGIQKMLDGTVITCTAWYTDGSTQSVDVTVSSKIMTNAEAFGVSVEEPEQRGARIVFELQE